MPFSPRRGIESFDEHLQVHWNNFKSSLFLLKELDGNQVDNKRKREKNSYEL
jgi:hypothetical protein